MILIPSMAKTAVSDLAHLAYIVNPTIYDDVDDSAGGGNVVRHKRIVSSIYNPPVSVLACAMASEWTLNASLSFDSVTISVTNQVLTYSPTITLGQKSAPPGSGQEITATLSSFDPSTGDDLNVELYIGGMPTFYGSVLGEWALPFGIRIDADKEAPLGASSYFGGNYNFGAVGGSFGGVAVTVAGESIDLHYDIDQLYAPSGTITLTPTAWLGFT